MRHLGDITKISGYTTPDGASLEEFPIAVTKVRMGDA